MPANSVASARLTDGRPQILAVNGIGQVWTTWKVDEDPNGAWAAWTQFPQPGHAYTVGTAILTDGRSQIQVATETGLFTTWTEPEPPTRAGQTGPTSGARPGTDPQYVNCCGMPKLPVQSKGCRNHVRDRGCIGCPRSSRLF
jgi:hypothetical protein